MAYIYKITNKLNGKIYIGKTTKTIEERYKEHCNDYMKDRNENRPLYRAMKKYGIKNFSIEEIEECSTSNSSERETYWIEYYNSFSNGYNATRGGDGKAYIDRELVYKTYLNVLNIRKTAELCNCCTETVSTILKEYNFSSIELKANGHLSRRKPVAKIDKNTNEIIEIYASVADAENANGNTRHIAQVCNGNRKTAAGYKWKYL